MEIRLTKVNVFLPHSVAQIGARVHLVVSVITKLFASSIRCVVMVLDCYGISTCDHVFEFISTLNPVIAVFHSLVLYAVR